MPRTNDKLMATWCPADLAAAFRRIAEAEERTVSSELRHLIRVRVAHNDERPRADGAVVTAKGGQALDGPE